MLLSELPTRKKNIFNKKILCLTKRIYTILSRARSHKICLILSLISNRLELVIARICAISCERIFVSVDRLNRAITSNNQKNNLNKIDKYQKSTFKI